MIVTIDGIEFQAKYDINSTGFPVVVIKLENEDDIKFLGKWAKACAQLSKEDYVKDIPFDTTLVKGVLRNSYCNVGLNEDKAVIRFDSYTQEWKDI